MSNTIRHSERQVYIMFDSVSLVLCGSRSLNADWLTITIFTSMNADFYVHCDDLDFHSVQKWMETVNKVQPQEIFSKWDKTWTCFIPFTKTLIEHVPLNASIHVHVFLSKYSLVTTGKVNRSQWSPDESQRTPGWYVAGLFPVASISLATQV